MIKAFLGHAAEDRGAEAGQSLRLQVDALLAGLQGQGPVTTGMDVDVQPVRDGLGVGDDLEPDLRSVALRVADPVRSGRQVLLGEPQVEVVVVPAVEPAGGGASS